MRRSVTALAGVFAMLLVFFLAVQEVYPISISMNPTCGPPGTVVTVVVQYNTASVVSVVVASTWGSGWGALTKRTCYEWVPGEYACEFEGIGDSGGFAVDAWDSWPEIVSATYTVDCPAVGGVLEPVQKFVILFPYVALVGLMAAIVVAKVKKRED